MLMSEKLLFSERERDIIFFLGKRKSSVKALTEDVFFHTHVNDRPIDAEVSIGNSIRRIKLKCHYHGLKWTLTREKHNGVYLYKKENV